MAQTIPAIHHLFHRPRPVVTHDLGGGWYRFRCGCGAIWQEWLEVSHD